jgi:prepilin-type N-terminal cleavage/methylation domain-containing protein
MSTYAAGSSAVRQRDGFTLIEVMIVTAVTVILLGAVFSINFRVTDMWRSERVRQALQQNFRFAADMVTLNLRQATGVRVPALNTLGDSLEFDYIATSVPETRKRVVYSRAGSAPGPYRIERSEIQIVDPDKDGVWTETGTRSVAAVTEDIASIAAVHFIHRGSRVVTILVAQYESGGETRTVSYTLQTSVRTLFTTKSGL